MKKSHKQVKIKIANQDVEVDEKLAPLLQALNDLEISTFMSCQSNVPKGYVWIMFVSAADVEAFLNIVADEYNSDPESIYGRAKINYDDHLNYLPKSWRYNIHIDDCNLDYEFDDEEGTVEETPDGPSSFFAIRISVRFPGKDLPFVEGKVLKYLENVKAGNPAEVV